MTPPVRLRQVALITHDLEAVTGRLRSELGLAPGFVDEGVGYFGLRNEVVAAGECFIEVLTPVRADSTGQRYLDRQGGESGYMALFQVASGDGVRDRLGRLGLRIVWTGDLPGISGTHIDPRDLPGAIVSIDWADPPESWHWAGPAWRGGSPVARGEAPGGTITSLRVAVPEPVDAAARWAAALGPGAVRRDASVVLEEAGQRLDFVGTGERGRTGIVGVGLDLERLPSGASRLETELGGVAFACTARPHDPGEDHRP